MFHLHLSRQRLSCWCICRLEGARTEETHPTGIPYMESILKVAPYAFLLLLFVRPPQPPNFNVDTDCGEMKFFPPTHKATLKFGGAGVCFYIPLPDYFENTFHQP